MTSAVKQPFWNAATRSSASNRPPATRREVDLLVRTPAGILGIEIKNRRRVAPSDAGPLRALAEAVGERWLGGLVVYRGSAVRPLRSDGSIWAVPGHRLF